MKNLGYIKLHRKIRDNPLYKKKRRFSKLEAWIDLLLLATHKEEKILIELKIVRIERGQIFTSQLGLSKKWRWSIGSVNSFLKFLKAETQIDYKGENKYTIISILNWDKYQGISEKNETRKESKTENKLKPNRKQTETFNNVRKNEREKDTLYSSFKSFFISKVKKELDFEPSLSAKDRKAYLTFLDTYTDKEARELVAFYFDSNFGNKFRTLATIFQPFIINAWLSERKVKEDDYD